MNANMRALEQARTAAEPSHLDALLAFAERAYRRPLTKTETDDLLALLPLAARSAPRSRGGDPRRGGQRADVAALLLPRRSAARRHGVGGDVRPSVGLRPGQPAELLPLVEHAGRGVAEACRGRRSAQARGARRAGAADDCRTAASAAWPPSSPATGSTSAGSRNTTPSIASGSRASRTSCAKRCSRSRFASCIDIIQRNGSVLDFLYGNYTFVNPVLARHYGMPEPAAGTWVRVDDAQKYGRGGLLPMSVFLTKNAPGLRTSPVKRGYWVVHRLLGEHIPAPPPNVPVLPADETKLGDLTLRETLAQHRANPACAGCHAKFDSFGLAFEGYGPVGETRRSGSCGTAGRNRRHVSRRQRGVRARRAARVHARARAGRIRRQSVPQAARLRPGPQPDAIGRAARSPRCARIWRPATTSSAASSRHRHQPAVPDETQRRSSSRRNPMTMTDQPAATKLRVNCPGAASFAAPA